MDWLRRWLGESRELADAREEITRLQQANTDLRAHNERLATKNQALAEKFDILLEPAQNEHCDKVRLRDQVEAEQFARRLERDLIAAPGAFKGYPCKRCPRQPVSTAKFWHVTHTEKAERGQGGRQHRRRGRGLAVHVDPTVMARLRMSAGGAE